MHDKAPFSLWDEGARKFHFPTPEQRKWIQDAYDAEGFQFKVNCCYLETRNPPKPVPLTLGCMPVLFVGINERPDALYPNAGHYANPRINDPCPHISWPKLSNPKNAQRIGILTALENLVNAKSITFLPSMTVVDLVHDDNRIYDAKSLPGIVAGRSTLYHHDASPFFNEMRDLKRERRIDPARYEIPEIGPLPVDYTNYLKEVPSLMTPGVRLTSGRGAAGTRFENLSQATSAGIRLRNVTNGQDMMTVANHGFSFSSEVYHPGEEDGSKIGEVVRKYPELDVAFVKLAPSEAHKLSNRVYFQAEPPVRLVSADEIEQGSWAEVDGMSSGLVSLHCNGVALFKPVRPPGHPEISFSQWKAFNISQVFGAVNDRMVDGMCGAPIVGCDTGDVLGFFHLGNGSYARSATLDDLIAEGWAVV